MANQHDGPMKGEQYAPKYPRDYPKSPSSLPQLPYYPNLKRELRSVTGAIILTYLEIYYPPPQDESGSVLRASVSIHLDRISEDLQISRRTLYTALCVLAARWRNEEARSAAGRTGREFLNPAHTINGRYKPYSITGAIGYIPHTIVQLRRNFPLLKAVLQNAEITTFAQSEFADIDHFKKITNDAIFASTVNAPIQKCHCRKYC